MKSDEFDNLMDKLIFIQSMKLFFDKYNFEEFYYKNDISLKEYKHYIQPIVKEYYPHMDKYYKKQIKKKEKKK